MLGELPANFLRVDGGPQAPQQQQMQVDAQTAQALQYQFASGGAFAAQTPRLSVTITQVSSYGMWYMQMFILKF